MLADLSKFISTCNSRSSCVYIVRERCKLVAFLAVSLGIRMYFLSHYFFWHNLGLVRLTQALAQDFSHLISSRPNLLGLCSGQYPRDLYDTKILIFITIKVCRCACEFHRPAIPQAMYVVSDECSILRFSHWPASRTSHGPVLMALRQSLVFDLVQHKEFI